MSRRLIAAIEVTAFAVGVFLAVLWAWSNDGRYEPWTILCGAAAGGLELYRRYVLKEESEASPTTKDAGGTRPSKDAAASLLEWLLSHVPSEDLSKTLPKALRLAKLLGDADFERWVRCELNGYLKPHMNDTDVVPEYRTVAGRYMDVYGRPLMIEDPNLSFVNEDRLRRGVRELEAHAKKDGMLYIQHAEFIQLIKEHLGVDVVQFEFNRASIYGILDSIRSELLDRLHRIEASRKAGDTQH